MSDRLARLSRQHALFPWERRTHSERTSERAEAVLAGISAAVEWKRDQDIAEEVARQQATEAAEQRAAAEEIERNQSAEMMAGAFAELRNEIEFDPQAAERDMLALFERLGIQPNAPGTGSLFSLCSELFTQLEQKATQHPSDQRFHLGVSSSRAGALTLSSMLRSYPADRIRALSMPPQVVTAANRRWDELHAKQLQGASSWSLAQLGLLRHMRFSSPPAVVSLGCGKTLPDDAAALRDLGIPIGEGSTLRGFDLLPYQFSNLPSGVGFCVASAAATGLPSASVDVVYVSNALYNHGELRPMAAETARILRPGERQRMLNRPCVAALATGSATAATTLGTNHAALLPHTD